MVTVRAIHNEDHYRAAMIRIEELMNALSGPVGQVDDPDDPRSIELDVLVDLVEFYESKTVEIGFPSVIDAIEFNLDRLGLTRRDLVPLIGSRCQGLGGTLGQAAHHHVDGPRPPPAPGNTRGHSSYRIRELRLPDALPAIRRSGTRTVPA